MSFAVCQKAKLMRMLHGLTTLRTVMNCEAHAVELHS